MEKVTKEPSLCHLEVFIMKRIFDKQRIQAAMDGIGLSQCMQTIDPGILIYEYSPGELVISPL